MNLKELNSRNQMNPQYTWKLSDMIESDIKWQSIYDEILSDTDLLTAFSGKLLDTPQTLFEGLSLKDTLFIKLHHIYIFSNMASHEDMNNTEAQERVQKVNALQVTVNSKIAFFEPEIMSANETTLINYIDQYESLKLYKHYLENMLRQKKHILPKEQEELLAFASDFSSTPGNIFSMFMNADLVLPEVIDNNHNPIRLTQGNYNNLLKSSDSLVRKTAFDAMYSKLSENKNTLASIYLSSIKKDVFEMRSRKFNSSCEASLDSKNIDVSVYDQLISTVHSYLPLLHRYVSLRKKTLGLLELHMYDLYVPIVSDMDVDINYDQAKELVREALAPLGEEYLDILNDGFTKGWIDVYENKGKRSGAYSWGSYASHPYVLLNFQNNLSNTFTLAHEMGHALHSYYSNKTQPFIYHKYPIFLAEVASTVNESLLIQHLLKRTKEKEKRKYLLNHYMESFRTTLYRQVMFAEFEKETHRLVENGEAVTYEVLNTLYYDLNKKYYGDDIIVDDYIKFEWARIPHFYTSFYVYQYATGFSSAVSLSQLILENDDAFVDKYKTFLKSGSSKYPLETLKEAGIDMTTTKPIEKALHVFESLLNEFESLI